MAKQVSVVNKGKCIPLYVDTLSKIDKQRYSDKTKLIGGLDPYSDVTYSDAVDILPPISYPDIVNYLIFTPSPYTSKDLKAFKSLDAYNQFICGWVRDRGAAVHGQFVIITAKVMHSQRLREKPLLPWVIVDKDGKIESGHCTCMAGLGEACSHIAALLFSVEATIKIRDSKTVTQEKAYWLLPSSHKKAEYKPVKEINFTSAKTAKKKLDESISNIGTPSEIKMKTANKPKCPKPSEEELSTFFRNLSHVASKPAILSLIEPYNANYIPKPVTENFPTILPELRDEESFDLTISELIEKCGKLTTNINCTDEQIANVEKVTKEQSQCKLWYRFRAGRITASNMKSVCHTNLSNPAKSVVLKTCYPEQNKFASKATKWGIDNEKTARGDFESKLCMDHENLSIEDQGFKISSTYPFIGCSVDGLVNCDCCGLSTLEIKCPYTTKNDKPETHECLEKHENTGIYSLKKSHEYFYQVQTQLGVYGLEQAYFVVWTEEDIHIETISFDLTFWNNLCSKAKHFFQTAVLPELVGKIYSRSTIKSSVHASSDSSDKTERSSASGCNEDEKLFCHCNQPEHGKMIACDNKNCEIEWFHYKCVKIERAPKGKWYCFDCRKNVKRN